MNKVYLSLGTNLGDKRQNMMDACELINTQIGTVLKKSRIYKTPPWGYDSHLPFFNAVVLIETTYKPHELLDAIKVIEQVLGRAEKTKTTYEDRLIDIDIIDFNAMCLDTSILKLPHEKMHIRNFVLVPMADISPEWMHPLLKIGIRELLEDLIDPSEIEVVTSF